MLHMPPPQNAPAPQDVAAALAELAAVFGNRLVTSQAVRDQHAHTLSWLARQPPDGVVFVQGAEDVQAVVRICSRHKVPLIPFGVGTSLEGQVNAPAGGISIDFRDMNRILEVHAEDLNCVVEPGVTRKQLNDYLRDKGLFFPIDPGADATLGGMASTRASGTNAVRYGTMRENVMALKAVNARGDMIVTGRRAKKSSAGYDLTHLMVGAEGTLGVITELTLRLHGIPEAISAGICPFPSIDAACNATILAIQSGIPVARIELLDEVQIRACNLHSKLDLPETPMLFLEFHGTEREVELQAERFAAIAGELGASGFDWATKAEDRTRLWQARHDAYWAARSMRPGTEPFITDVCVPISRLAECVRETQDDLRASRLISPIVGHVGDGNFHLILLCDMNDADEVSRAEGLLDRLVRRALAMDGTCTGEHGIGQGKQSYLADELGEPALEMMRALKTALDPDNILNPGKIFSRG